MNAVEEITVSFPSPSCTHGHYPVDTEAFYSMFGGGGGVKRNYKESPLGNENLKSSRNKLWLYSPVHDTEIAEIIKS